MILSDGKNNFINNVYSFWEWSAPVLQTYDEILSKFSEMKLEERKVKDIYCVGMAYNWCEYNLSELVGEMSLKEEPLSTADILLKRWAEIDEPFLIEFDDGDILAVDYSEGSSVRLDLNTIPKNISFGTNKPNIHADKLFENIIGTEIASVEITTSTVMPCFTGSHGLTLEEQPSYITGFNIHFRKECSYYPQYSLAFTSNLDFGIVELKDDCGKTMEIHASELRKVVAGFTGEDFLNELEQFNEI